MKKRSRELKIEWIAPSLSPQPSIMGLGFLGFMGSQIQGMIVEGMRTTQQQEQQARQGNEQALFTITMIKI